MSTLALNKQAKSDYSILDTFEAGIKLSGPEVKSAKKGSINLKGSFIAFASNGALTLFGMHIAPYPPAKGQQVTYDPTRSRILLLTKKQRATLFGALKEKRASAVPLSLYTKGGLVKVEMALVQGKKKYEKRAQIKKRDIERDIGRRLKN